MHRDHASPGETTMARWGRVLALVDVDVDVAVVDLGLPDAYVATSSATCPT
jgi:hypothetical protein